MINFSDRKNRKIFSSIIIAILVIAMIVPTVLGALNGFF